MTDNNSVRSSLKGSAGGDGGGWNEDPNAHFMNFR